jgi:hypothetical protein
MMWKEAVVAYFKVPLRNLPGGTGENCEELQTVYLVSQPRFELDTSSLVAAYYHYLTNPRPGKWLSEQSFFVVSFSRSWLMWECYFDSRF